MVGPRVLFLYCHEFEGVPSSLAGIDSEELLGLLHTGFLDATGDALYATCYSEVNCSRRIDYMANQFGLFALSQSNICFDLKEQLTQYM